VTPLFAGCGTALVTPFAKAEGPVDEAALRRHVKRQVAAGIHFLVPCGTTGENPTLGHDERRRVVEIVLEEAGKVPVLAGAGGYDTREVVASARAMAALGAHGLLSVTPYYNKPTPDGLYAHYAEIAAATDLPIVVYNVPGRTGCNVDVATLSRLATIPHIVGVKEASGNIMQICQVCHDVPAGFTVLSGDDALTVPMMALGARGVISVIANEAPRPMVEMVEAAAQGRFDEARRLHNRLLPLMMLNFVESNPIPVKAALAEMGLMAEAYRLPMVPLRAESRVKLVAALRDLGLLSDNCR
jgi:4-hydroxy-tetrahydrodipicolinate synthase